MRPIRRYFVLAILSFLVSVLAPGTSFAAHETDGDWPSGLAFFGEGAVSGNPLDRGDVVFGVRGTYRLPGGDVGLELGVGFTEPTSDFVRGLGNDADLALVDLSFVWYANYRSWYSKVSQSDPWYGKRRIKPEFIVFGGPGWGSLRIDDAFPNFPLSDAVQDYFTLHGGAGVEIHWLRSDPGREWDHRTSRWYLRPEVRGRWFTGDDGKVDWTVGLSLGVNFGNRPTKLALQLKVDQALKEARSIPNEIQCSQTLQKMDDMWDHATEQRRGLEELKAYALSHGPRCDGLREQLDEAISRLNNAVTKIQNCLR